MRDDEQAVGPRLGGQDRGAQDRQPGEGPYGLVRQRGVGRADDARVVPGDAPFQAMGLLGGRAIFGRGGGDDEQEHRETQAQRPHHWGPLAS